MQEYDIRSVPVKGMIEQLAEDFKTDFLVRLGEYSIQLPESIGNGFISGINFPNGVGLISYDCTFLEDTVFDFTADQIHPLKFLFCSEGAFEFRVPDSNEMNTIFSSQHIIAASSLKNSHRLIFKKGRTTNICSIEIDRIQYLEQLEFDIQNINFNVYQLLADVNATQSFYQAGNYSLEIAQNIKSLKDFNGSDLIRTNFLGAKSLEMLAHALNQYVDDKENEKPLLIRASEVQLVDKAKEFILTRFSENINLDEIAQFAGLPIHKLQEGFKMVFGCTVNKYIQDTRLDHAFKLLGQGDLNVNEVVNAIGFSSRSHFAKIFKERFGLSPKRFMLSRNKAQ